MRRIAAGLALAAPFIVMRSAPCIAQPPVPAIRFAPPLDQVLAYTVVQYVGTGKGQRRFDAIRHLRFTQDRGGYRLAVTLHAISGDAPADALTRYRAALAPLIGLTQYLRVDGSGRIIAIDNLQDVWAAFMQGQRALLALSARKAQVQATIDYLDGRNMAERLAVCAGDVQPLMLFASGTPLPSMRLEDANGPQTLIFTESQNAVGRVARYTVERATGLVLEAERHVPEHPQKMRETRQLTMGER